jgi:hypothetical protein
VWLLVDILQGSPDRPRRVVASGLQTDATERQPAIYDPAGGDRRRRPLDRVAGQLATDGGEPADVLHGRYFTRSELLPEVVPGVLTRYEANNCGEKRWAWRADAFAGRRELWRMSRIDRVRKCGRVARDLLVRLSVTPSGDAGLRGLTTCGSVWACPVCALSVMTGRAQELESAITAWHAQGGSVALVTLTMRHQAGQGLGACWDASGAAWRAASGGSRKVRDVFAAAGVVGWARRVEVTHGVNGWHVHVHALVFLRDPAQLGAVSGVMFGAWAAALKRMGFDGTTREHGLDCKLVSREDRAGDLAGYLATATYRESGSVARELASASGKRAKRGNRTPFDILADYARAYRAATPCGRDRALWDEWETESVGRRAITWSRGVRELLALGDELTDDDLAGELDGESEIVCAWSAREWQDAVCWRDVAGLLELVERAPHHARYAVALRWAHREGVPRPRPGPYDTT